MPDFESSRKVQVFGSSLAMTLPALFVKANEVEKGSVTKVYYGLKGVLVASMVDEPAVICARLREIIDILDGRLEISSDGRGSRSVIVQDDDARE